MNPASTSPDPAVASQGASSTQTAARPSGAAIGCAVRGAANTARMGSAAAARNRAWIPVLTGAASKGPVFAAFGALHLSGQDGVLNLLQREGFTLEELKL